MWISGARIIFILISSPVGLRRSLRAAIDCSSLMPNARLFTKAMLGTIMPDRSTAANNVSTIDMRTEKKREASPVISSTFLHIAATL